MPLNITTNAAAASASYYLGKNQSALQKSMTRLASGKKIIAPYDDPGSLSVSMKLQASINRLGGAQNNIRNGISFLEVQDGLLAFGGRILDRMAELKGLSSQDPMKSSLDQASYNDEFKDRVKVPYPNQHSLHVYHQYVLRSPRMPAIKDYLNRREIQARTYYPTPLHKTKTYAQEGNFAHAEIASDTGLAIPVHQWLTEQDIDVIIKTMKEIT